MMILRKTFFRAAVIVGRSILAAACALSAVSGPPAGAQGAGPAAAAVSTATPGGTRFRDCPDCPDMTVVGPGSFTMGSPPTEYGRYDVEGPPHRVTIRRAFAASTYFITRAQYRRFVDETGHTQEPGCDFAAAAGGWLHDPNLSWRDVGFPQSEQDPVLCMTWNDAAAYIDWLNTKAGAAAGRYRFLSEAEYEYAARAGTTTPFYWSDKPSHDYANYGLDWCDPCGPAVGGRDRWLFTSPVGSFPPNGFGLFDMAGDVWTYTADCWNRTYDGAPDDGSAWGTGDCKQRTVRGGGWEDPPHYLRVATRWPNDVTHPSPQIGFRIARTLEEKN